MKFFKLFIDRPNPWLKKLKQATPVLKFFLKLILTSWIAKKLKFFNACNSSCETVQVMKLLRTSDFFIDRINGKHSSLFNQVIQKQYWFAKKISFFQSS